MCIALVATVLMRQRTIYIKGFIGICEMNILILDFKYLVMLYLKSNVHIKVDCKFVVIMHYAFHIILIIGKGLTLVSVLSY